MSSRSTVGMSSIAPVFVVRNVSLAVGHYRDVLGFEVRFVNERPPEPAVYAVLRRDDIVIHFMSERDGMRAGNGAAHVMVTGVAALHEELGSRGAHIVMTDFTSAKHDLRTFTVKDVDGNQLSFAEPS
jgi:uncharacterized glyoxalase superfamily protein PhnB